MFRLQFDDHAVGLKNVKNSVGHACGEPFLQLGPVGGHLQRSGKFADPGDLAVGHVAQTSFAEEGQQMMFAHGIENQAVHDDWVMVLGFEDGIYRLCCVRSNTGE